MLITCHGMCFHRIWVKSILTVVIKTRAAWHGTRIILRQVSLEAIGIFDFIIELYASCSGDWNALVAEGWMTQDDCNAFLDYAATFLSNVGNYYVSISLTPVYTAS